MRSPPRKAAAVRAVRPYSRSPPGEGSGSGTVVVVISQECGAVGEGPVSAGLGPPAVHPPASSAAASSAGDRRTDARVECPAAFMGESYPAFALARSQPRIWTGSRDGLEVPLMDPGRGRPDRGANNHTPAPMRWNRTRDRGRRRIHPSQDIPGSDPPSGVQRPECDHPVGRPGRTGG